MMKSGTSMTYKTLVVEVPGNVCAGKCCFCCVDRDKIIEPKKIKHLSEFMKIYSPRMNYAKDLGCDTMLISGNIEPMQVEDFIADVLHTNKEKSSFWKIELQTSGYKLKDHLNSIFLDQIHTISLSISSFDFHENERITGFKLDHGVIKDISRNYNLRLSINLTRQVADFIKRNGVDGLFKQCKALGARQIVIRQLDSYEKTKNDSFIMQEREYAEDKLWEIEKVLFNYGKKIGKYRSIDGMSVFIDDDCLNKNNKDRRLILRQDGKLYTSWDNPASLIF